jgi:hypothetical protein
MYPDSCYLHLLRCVVLCHVYWKQTFLRITLEFSVILCMEYFIQFRSYNTYMYNSKTIIRFLHYMFRPLFLAIIKLCLYSTSQLSLLSPPPLAYVCNWEKVMLFTRQVFSYRLKRTVNYIKFCSDFPKGIHYSQCKRISVMHRIKIYLT